jgi:hypothetical protein
MGDFSRDTFQLTNVLAQVLTGQTVTNPRHYVAVRLQQGVPLMDSDWNELEDLRRLELQALVKLYIGTGVPAGNDGFRISSSGDANNFSIHDGVILAGGLLAINLGLTTYLAQPEQTGLPALTTPGGIVDRTDLVYLEVWHDEIAAAGGPDADGRLMNAVVGVETAVRIRRRWQVRVAEGATTLGGIVPAAGHVLLPLALLRRRAGVTAISDTMVVDRRVTGLTVSTNLKSPLNVSRGGETVNCARFAQMMHNLRTALFQRLVTGQLPHSSPSPQQESFLLVALQTLMNCARAGETQALAQGLAEADALALLGDLYQSQQDWLTSLGTLGNVGNVAKPFIDSYTSYLNGQPGTLISGLKPALDASDVIAAVMAQEALNLFLASAVDTLPEGTVVTSYKMVSPFVAMASGTTFTFTFDITAQITSPQATEVFAVNVSLPADFGTATPATTQLTFPTGGAPSTQTVAITVNPTGVAGSGSLAVVATAVRSAALHSTQSPLALVRGATPPAPAFFFYAGPALNSVGQLSVSQAQIQSTGRDVIFRLKNGSATDSQTYQVTGQVVIPASESSTGWSPLTVQSLPPTSLAANSETPVAIHIAGPNPAPAPGFFGSVVATAVLIRVNGVAVATPQTPVIVTVPFVVV